MGGGGWGKGSGSGWGVRVDVNEELKFLWGGGVGGSVGGVWLGGGGQGGCERRIEVFVKIQKKNFFWGGGGRWGGRWGVGVGGRGSEWM